MFTHTSVALPLIKRALRGRRLVVMDIENVVGGAVMTVEEANAARGLLHEVVTLSGQEQIVIGSSHVGAFTSHQTWPNARLLLRSGENGADLALLEVLTEERVEERFDEIILVSGDGIFTEAVSILGAAGVSVTVVAHPDGCAKRLRMAAGHTVFFNNRLGALEGAA